MSTLQFLADGFAIAFQWHNLLFAFVGVVIGTAVGVLPGIGPMSGVALLIPVTATMTSGMPTECSCCQFHYFTCRGLLRRNVWRIYNFYFIKYPR